MYTPSQLMKSLLIYIGYAEYECLDGTVCTSLRVLTVAKSADWHSGDIYEYHGLDFRHFPSGCHTAGYVLPGCGFNLTNTEELGVDCPSVVEAQAVEICKD